MEWTFLGSVPNPWAQVPVSGGGASLDIATWLRIKIRSAKIDRKPLVQV